MSRDQIMPERGLRAALVGLAAALALSGCGAGQVAQTSEQVSAVNGAGGETGPIALRDVVLAYPGDEHVVGYEPGDDAPLLVTIVNSGDRADELVSVTTPAAGEVVIEGTTTIPGDGVVTSRHDAGTAGAAHTAPSTHPATPSAAAPTSPAGRPLAIGGLRIVLTKLTGPIRPGLPTHVTFTFRHAGDVRLRVPIDAPAEAREEHS